MSLRNQLAALWAITRFPDDALTAYAEQFMVDETRKGVMTMSFVSLMLLSATSLLYTTLGFGTIYAYTNMLLAALSLHIFFSSRVIQEVRVLHLLGMTLLVISGVAFVLLAHRTGAFSAILLGSVVLLFMVVPLVPWGVKEASLVVSLVYSVFTVSTWKGPTHFDLQVLWTLQFVMAGASLVTLVLVGRGVAVRKDDIRARFELEGAHRRVEVLSYQDPLTGLWNRRYLQHHYPRFLEQAKASQAPFWFVLCDLNDFKQLNDTRGHDFGDKVLQWLASALRSQIGDRGIAVRMGGDEFALLFAQHSPREILERAIETVRALAQGETSGQGPEVAISAGVVALPAGAARPLDEVYRQADAALYRAKEDRAGQPLPVHLAGHLSTPEAHRDTPWASAS